MSGKIEYLDLYDENGNFTGETMERGDPIPAGRFYYIAKIFITDGKGKLLVTKRHPNKHHPNLWECTGGVVTAGETPLEGAVRELFEETGIKALPDELEFIGVYTNREKSYKSYKYLLRKDIALSELRLQPEEVTDAKWVTAEKFSAMNDAGLVVPSVFERYLKFEIERKLTT